MRWHALLLASAALLLLAACDVPPSPEPPVETPQASEGAEDETDDEAANAEPAEDEAPAAAPARRGAEGDGGLRIVCEEGEDPEDCAEGTQVVVAEVSSQDVAFTESLYPEPVVALVDLSPLLRGEPEVFVPDTGQILGHITEPLFPGPGAVRVSLPFRPTADPIDLDGDEARDEGVQVYGLHVASNIIGDSYLQQMEQVDGLSSYLQDVRTGALTQGRLLVYAPDAQQGFPSGAGEDGVWLSADDPIATLPAGYSVVELGEDGRVTVDRSREAAMPTIEREEAAMADYSDLGIRESFDALIDHLAERYAYTELRDLDWEEIREAYGDRVDEADAAGDDVAYFLILDELTTSIGDGHVSASAYANLDAVLAMTQAMIDRGGGNLGATVIAASSETEPQGPSPRLVVSQVNEGSPAEAAGWVTGTEIVAVDGTPVEDYLATKRLLYSTGTEEARLWQRSQVALTFPMSQTVTIDYRLPGADEVQSADMVAGAYSRVVEVTPSEVDERAIIRKNPITYQQRGNYAIVSWNDFMNYLPPKIAVLEEALSVESTVESQGMILDLRGNTGGWVALYETMASYFFTEDEPMPVHVFDWWYYDAEAGEHVRSFHPDYRLSAPRPTLAYTGPLAILVDQSCASACEYFSQHLQELGRATIVGQYASNGAGGFIDRVALPGDIQVTYTAGQTTFAGTEEPNLEAKGVIPDIRVPITLETEQAEARGEDPVLEAALAELDRIVAEAEDAGASQDEDGSAESEGEDQDGTTDEESTSEGSTPMDDDARIESNDTLAALAAVYGGPSAEGFGGAVFARPLGPEDELEAAARAVYQDFVGELWERWGEEAWMGPWREVYARPEGAEADIVAELQGLEDAEARRSVPLVLEVVEDPEAARAALSAVFDDPAVQELAVYNVGDGEAMSGLLLAARGPEAEEGVFLVVLLD